MFYQEKYRIQSLVCDASDHLSLWGLSRLFQEVAEEHTFATGIGYDALIQQNKAWVLCRMLYEVKQMPKLWDNVILTTWSRGTNGLFAVRDFRMVDEANSQLLASATAYWAVIDFNTRHVTRLHDLMTNYEHHDLMATRHNELHKLRPPKELQNSEKDVQLHNNELLSTQYTVQHFVAKQSMLDHTHHVNNAEYLKWISNHWPCFESFQPFQLQVDYIQETRLDENITIQRYPNTLQIVSDLNIQNNNTYFYQISNSRGIAANIEVLFDLFES